MISTSEVSAICCARGPLIEIVTRPACGQAKEFRIDKARSGLRDFGFLAERAQSANQAHRENRFAGIRIRRRDDEAFGGRCDLIRHNLSQ